MKKKLRVVSKDESGNFCLKEIEQEEVLFLDESVMGIDGSTTNTGISIIRKADGALLYSFSLQREKSSETPVQYKVRLKKFVDDILGRNKNIGSVFYEEPFVGEHATSVGNLMMLRTFVEELVLENEPKYDYLKREEINNMKWKKIFLAPTKCPQGTEAQKKAVRNKLIGYMPFLDCITQDEVDAICLGMSAVYKIRQGLEDELKSKKAVKPFQYEIRFIGADDTDDMLQELHDIYNGPDVVMQNGILLKDIGSRANFEKKIYELMGQEDKLLILKYKSGKYGNLTLQYNIGHLVANYEYIYALVWRKNRKK